MSVIKTASLKRVLNSLVEQSSSRLLRPSHNPQATEIGQYRSGRYQVFSGRVARATSELKTAGNNLHSHQRFVARWANHLFRIRYRFVHRSPYLTAVPRTMPRAGVLNLRIESGSFTR